MGGERVDQQLVICQKSRKVDRCGLFVDVFGKVACASLHVDDNQTKVPSRFEWIIG